MKLRFILRLLMGANLAALGEPAFATIIGNSNYVAQSFYANPHTGETLVSFDWDGTSNLYYSTGRPNYGLGLSLYRYNGVHASNLFTDINAFSGNRVTMIGGRLYFNDGGNYDRYTCDYYQYDPAHPSAPTNIGMLSDIYGLETRNGSDFWAAGGYSAAIYYSPLDAQGELESNPLINLGTIGAASGPILFDADGNLFYAEGYVAQGHPTVYRWSAAEVAAAIANPVGSPLTPVNHAWTTLSAGDGASGMAVDDNGNLVVTATSFTAPSELQRLFVTNGIYAGYEVMARSYTRLETVRVREGKIYVSSPDGIFAVVTRQTNHPLNDYDGDGTSDLAFYRNGYWSIYSLAQRAVILDNGGVWGGPDCIPVSGDYDGDGKADLAFYRNGYWSIYSLAKRTVLLYNAGPWGGPDCIPVSGDYDGDGASDLTFYRSGYWSIYSLAKQTIVLDNAGVWGGPDCIPVQ